MKNGINRRKFLKQSGAGALGLAMGSSQLIGMPALHSSKLRTFKQINGVQLGCITYSFRSLEDQSAEATLQYVKECGINAIELMGDPAESFAGMPQSDINRMRMWMLGRKERSGEELTADEKMELEEMKREMEDYQLRVQHWRGQADMKPFEQLKKMYHDEGVMIYAFKPAAFGKNNLDVEINYGMRAAKALGASHVTLEHPSDDAHTLKLGSMAASNGVKVAYHGHEQQTFGFWDTALEQSAHNALNLDAGHYIAAGNHDLFPLLEKHHRRIMSMHLKDRQTPENGKGNVEWGSGDTPIPEILKLMQRNKYPFPGTVELEYQIPEGSDPVKEVQKCIAFCELALK